MTIIRETAKIQQTEEKKLNPPRVQKWKGYDMIRNQSFLATAKEIIDYSEEIDVTRIGIIGDMMSGKSTLAQAIAHAVHMNAKIQYNVQIFFKQHLLNFKETLGSLEPTNYILIFDDVSFLKASATAKQINMIEEAITTIRHMDGGQDVKIIAIFNYHYPKALPPFLREAQFKYVTSVGDVNEKNIADVYGKDNVKLVTNFKMLRKRAIAKKYWMVKVSGRKDPVKYNYRDPFIPVLFWNEERLRPVVSPTRHFMDKICPVCAKGEKSEISLEQFKKESEEKFTEATFKAAVKLKLKEMGIANTYSNKFVQAQRYLDKALFKKQINLEDLAVIYGLKPTKAQLHKKLDGVLAD